MKKKGDATPEVKRTSSFCYHCNNAASFFLYKVDEYSAQGESLFFQFATCDVCNGPAVFLRTDAEDDPEASFRRLFPQSRNVLACSLPTSVERSYFEVLKCEEAGAPLACVVMVGRTLEAVCKEHFAPNGPASIYKGLQRLHEEGLISDQLKEWADELRMLRNTGAHEVSEDVSLLDAKEAIGFLRSILENLYDLGPRFREFKDRRSEGSR